MLNLTLKQLRYFDALARHGHFGRAAEVCAISQPALSMQIREMEEALGAGLFERGARSVRLTAFGEAMWPRVRDILRSVDELGDMARAARGVLAGRLRIGVIPTIAPYLLPAIIGRLTEQNPSLDLHLRETITPKLIAELLEGRLDTAIVALPVSEPALAEVELFSEDFVLVRPGAEGSSLSTLVQMVGAGIGVTLIPEMAVGIETRSAHVSVARFAGAQPSRRIGMVWRRSSPLARQLMQVADVVRAVGQGQRQTAAS